MKKIKIILMILLVIIFFEDNKLIVPNRKEITELELTKIIGMDKCDKYGLVELSLVRNKAETKGEAKSNVITVEASTFMNGFDAMQTYTNKQFTGGHIKYFLLGEDAARENINKYTDFISRDVELRMNGKIFIVKGNKASKLLSEGTSKDYKLERKIENISKNIYGLSNFNESTIADLLKILISEQKSGIIPTLSLMKIGEPVDQRWSAQNSSNEEKEEEKEEYDIIFDGYGVIKGGRLVGFLNQDETRGYNFFINAIKSTSITIYFRENELVNLNVVKSKCTTDFEFEDDKLKKIIIGIDAYSDIDEIQANDESLDDETIKYIENEQSKIIKNEVMNAVDAMKKYGIDFLGIGEILEFKHPYKWYNMRDEWEEILFNTQFEFNVNSLLQRTYDIRENAN